MSGKNGMQRRLMLDGDGKVLKLKNDVAAETLPAAVKKAADGMAKGAKMVRSTQVTADGKVTYEVEMDIGGRPKVVLLDPAGATVKIEETVLLPTVPAPVKAEVEKNVGHGRLIKVVAITDTGKPTTYEAQYETDAKKAEIKLGADGHLLGRE